MIGQASAWTPLTVLAVLTVVFSIKHFLADFVLQTGWIALGKDCRTDWLRPLLAHVAIHAVLALAIILVVAPRLWWLALVDFAIHFAVDRGKTVLGQGSAGYEQLSRAAQQAGGVMEVQVSAVANQMSEALERSAVGLQKQ